jgi:hypothetical protein
MDMNLVFGQGLILTYAYNHQEAERFFREAVDKKLIS